MLRYPPMDLGGLSLDWSRPYICGVINATPDSFSDGGRYFDAAAAIARGIEAEEQGADLLDVGGESTRPGAEPVPASEEMERVIPVIRALAHKVSVPISVDTTKAEVARAALAAGATLVNDISGGVFDPDILEVTAKAGAAFICGHVRGESLAEVHAAESEPPTFEQVAFELAARVSRVPPPLRRRVIVDPGLGFGKRAAQNLELLRRSGELGAGLSCPVMVGPSRKRFLGELTGRGVHDRDAATVGAALAAVCAGAQIVRVHDVGLLAPALRVFAAAAGLEELS